ncbi:MAG: T9SS type A sorting domain-containing protein, partial [Ignavibacteria bacterium]
LPPVAIDLVTIPMNDWLAQGRYIIKSVQEPFAIDTLGISIPGSLRELVEFRSATLVLEDDLNPQKFFLRQNYPNPFNGRTIISFSLTEKNFVNLTVYDCLGRKITELVNKELDQGEHLFEFEADQFKLKTGVYFYSIFANGYRQTRSMIYLK